MIRQVMVFINISGETIKNTFASFELKNIRGHLVKLYSTSVNRRYIFYNKKILVKI